MHDGAFSLVFRLVQYVTQRVLQLNHIEALHRSILHVRSGVALLGAPVRVYPRTDTSSASSVSYVSCSSWSTSADCDRSPLFQPSCHIERVVCENHVDPGAFEAGQGFQDDPALVDPAAEGGGLDHGVLARDVVGRHRDVEGVLDAAGDVEVGQGRLDHDTVGTLRQVKGDLADRLVAVGRVHLVAAAIAKAGGTFGRVAERPVIAAGELGGVGHDRDVCEAGAV